MIRGDGGVSGFDFSVASPSKTFARSDSRRTSGSASAASVLLIEDAVSLAQVYTAWLAKAGISVDHATTGAAGLDALARGAHRVLLLDLQLPDMNGMDVLARLGAENHPVSVVVITANASLNVAVEAMRRGAHDFLVKPVHGERLVVTTRNALEASTLKQTVDAYREAYDRERYHGFIGASRAMQAVYRTVDAAAASRATVFVTGESGTGKELCAEAIHRASGRRDRPFVAVNCAAIPRDLIESELFGHVKGAFTGAVADRVGAAKQADGGTLFLDEIGEMVVDLQTKLLRFLQTGQIQRVGDARQERVDARIVCATNRDPLAEVRAGRFREDLYYRLHVVPIHLPPLRERDDDVLRIARHLLAAYAREERKGFKRFDRETEAILVGYDWPGNVRQLQNVVRNAVVLHDGEVLTAAMLPPLPSAAVAAPADPPTDLDAGAMDGDALEGLGRRDFERPDGGAGRADGVQPLWRVERDAIERAVRLCGGNVARAAALLEINPSTIYRRRQSWADAEAEEAKLPCEERLLRNASA